MYRWLVSIEVFTKKENVPQSLMYLNTWSLIGAAVVDGYGKWNYAGGSRPLVAIKGSGTLVRCGLVKVGVVLMEKAGHYGHGL